MYIAHIRTLTNTVLLDGYFEFDLTAWDHRECAIMLIQLAVVEPGENLLEQSYEHSYIESPLPGWEMPRSWSLEFGEDNGPRRCGVLRFFYTSVGEGCGESLGV